MLYLQPGDIHVCRDNATRQVVRTILLALVGMLFAGSQSATAQDVQGAQDNEGAIDATVGNQEGRFGIGFASSWPTHGISGTMRINDEVTAEAVVGFLGPVSNYGGRAWYRFNRNSTYDIYGYAAVSVFRHRHTEFIPGSLDTRRATESVLGLGGGVGIETGIQTIFQDRELPPVFVNWEIGIALASFDHYNFSSFAFGGGVHYRFGGP